MKKTDKDSTIKVIVINPPTKEQGEKRQKELAVYLGQVWNNPKRTS